MLGKEDWEGSVAGAQSVVFFVTLVLCRDPDPLGEWGTQPGKRWGLLSRWLRAWVLLGTGRGSWITVNPSPFAFLQAEERSGHL